MDQNNDPAIVEFWKDFRKEHGIGPNTWKEHMLCMPPTREGGAERKPEHTRSIVGEAAQAMQDYQRALYGTSVQNNPGAPLAGLEMFGSVIVDTVTCKWVNVVSHLITVLAYPSQVGLRQWYHLLCVFEQVVADTAQNHLRADGMRWQLRHNLQRFLDQQREDYFRDQDLHDRLQRYASGGILATQEEREKDAVTIKEQLTQLELSSPESAWKNINLKDFEK